MIQWPWRKRDYPEVEIEPVVVGAPRGPGEIDKLSPTWIAVEDYLKAEIERQRDRNESATADTVKTALMRGQIRALRGCWHCRKRNGASWSHTTNSPAIAAQ